MRRAINENPVVKIAMIGVLLVVVGMLFAKRVLNRDSGSSSTPAAQTSTASPESTTSSAAASTETTASGTVSAPAATAVPTASVPGRPLPPPVRAAYAGDDTVVLLVTRGGGIDDKLVRASVERLRAEPSVSVFVTNAKGIARYSRITSGVAVNRVPALVVVRPQHLSNGVPTAEVSYGFRSAASVAQAVRDAQYKGATVPYHPN